MSFIPAIIAALMLAVVPAAAQDQEASAADPSGFIRRAIEDNIAAVEAARLARKMPDAPDPVRQLGERIGEDNTRWSGKLALLADRHGVRVSAQLPRNDRAVLDGMSKLRGTEFTRAYLEYVIDDLNGTIGLYRQAERSQDQTVADFARQTLPEMEDQLRTAQAVYGAQLAAEPGRR